MSKILTLGFTGQHFQVQKMLKISFFRVKIRFLGDGPKKSHNHSFRKSNLGFYRSKRSKLLSFLSVCPVVGVGVVTLITTVLCIGLKLSLHESVFLCLSLSYCYRHHTFTLHELRSYIKKGVAYRIAYCPSQ